MGALLPSIICNVWDYGAKGDGVTDDGVAIQAALNDAKGRDVLFPGPGKYLHTQTLYPQPETHMRGQGHGLGGGAPVSSQLKSRVAGGPAIYGMSDLLISDLIIAGDSTGVGVRLDAGSLWAERVHFLSFGEAVRMGAGFYYRFNMCEWAYCTRGLVSLQPVYNVDLAHCVMRFVTIPFDAGQNKVRKLAVVGGSYEEFGGVPSFVAGPESSLSVVGAYFETGVSGPVFGFDVRSGSVFNLNNNVVYMQNVDRWVNCSGQSGVVLNGFGNMFLNADGGQGYVLPQSGDVNLFGDSWSGSGSYAGDTGSLPPSFHVRVPS